MSTAIATGFCLVINLISIALSIFGLRYAREHKLRTAWVPLTSLIISAVVAIAVVIYFFNIKAQS